MGKDDRYNLDGVDDDLDGTSGPPSGTDPGEQDPDDDTPVGKTDRNERTTTQADPDGETTATRTDTDGETVTQTSSSTSGAETASGGAGELPHRVRYDSPKAERTAKTFYLDDERDIGRIRELQTVAEAEFGEKVHQLDVYVAAFRSDLSEEGFLAEMRTIGYGYFE